MYLFNKSLFSFFHDTATTDIYTLSLHDALPISQMELQLAQALAAKDATKALELAEHGLVNGVSQEVVNIINTLDRKSTRLNSSHTVISYAVFCLKKKKKKKNNQKKQH